MGGDDGSAVSWQSPYPERLLLPLYRLMGHHHCVAKRLARFVKCLEHVKKIGLESRRHLVMAAYLQVNSTFDGLASGRLVIAC